MEEQKFKVHVQKNISFIKISKILLSRWYWVFGLTITAIGIAQLFLWLTPERYAVHALLKFEEKRTEISELINIRNLYERTSKTASERLIIQSKAVLNNAVVSLAYPVSFYQKERFRWKELYPRKPIDITILQNQQALTEGPYFEFSMLNKKKYLLAYDLDGRHYESAFFFGQVIQLYGIKFRINSSKTKACIAFKFNTTGELVRRLENALKIDELPNSNLLSLHLVDQNPVLATDLLNANLKAYLQFDKSKRLVSISQTKNFIDTLLREMAKKLQSSGQEVAAFKTEHQFLNVSENAVEQLSGYELEKYNLEFENNRLSVFQTDISHCKKTQQLLQLPSNHFKDNAIHKSISSINELLLKKQDALNFYTANAPTLLRIEGQISTLFSTLKRNIEAQKRENRMAIQNLAAIIGRIKNNFDKSPGAERILTNLQTQFNVNQKIYSYLAEKKLEAQISNAAVVPGAIIIDPADYPLNPVYPLKKNVYTLFILAGASAGMALIYLVRRLNPHIYHCETVRMLSQIPIIGIIGKVEFCASKSPKTIPMLDQPGSIFAESIRVVRSNLNFLPTPDPNKSICITSDSSGEGKSFISANLAGSLSLLGKSVLVIAADLRKPRINLIFNPDHTKGLSHYLCGQAKTHEIIAKTPYQNIDFIPSGPIPPNPSELLHTEHMKSLLRDVKTRYDYIIVDTAPIGLVTDAIPLVQLTDLTLFIIRAGVSHQEAALSPERLKREFNISHIAIVLNAFKNERLYSDYTRQDMAKTHDHTQQELQSYFNSKNK